MVAFSRVAVALSAVSSIAAFSPSFSRPKQCSPFAITWSTSSIFGLAPSALAPPTSISISFIPVQSSQNPYTVDVPCHPYSEELEQSFLIERLPFPHGSQIYAEVHVPGVKGVLTRRRISDVWTVGQHPVGDNSCLENAPDRHIFARQVNVIGASFIDANVVEPTEVIDVPSEDSPAAAPTESAPTGAAQAVRVIGITTIPADESSVPEEDLEETLPEDELPEDVLLEDPETLPEDPETIDDEYTDEYSYGEEYGSDESTITDPAAENPHYVDEPLEHDETYYEDALPEEDPNAWQDDYYGSGDWVQVDEEGASSYLDESTAVKYDSLEEMVNHANKKWKAWNPVNYYKNDEDNSTLPTEIPHKNDTNSTETEYPEDYELEYSEDYQEDEYLEDVKPESAYDDYESIDDAELAVMPSDATGSLYIALPSAIPV